MLQFRNISATQIGQTEIADLTLASQHFQCFYYLGNGSLSVPVMDLVKVNVIGTQPLQAALAGVPDPLGGIIIEGVSVLHPDTKLCGNHRIIAPGPQCLSQCALGLSQAVGIRCVKEIDALVHGRVHRVHQFILLHLTPAVAAHGAATHTNSGNPEI